MEETKSHPKPSGPATPETPQTQPPPPPPPLSSAASTTAARPPTHSSKKRKHDHNGDTHYRKLRALVKSLRPHFIEVLRTPDFRNSQAAHEIRKKLKRMMDVHKQMTVETATVEMSKKQSEGQSVPGEHKDGQKNVDKNREEKQDRRGPEKSLEPPLDVKNSLKPDVEKLPESYVVGGSNFGWNFIMYPGGKAVYYGVTKEARRISNRAKMNSSKSQ